MAKRKTAGQVAYEAASEFAGDVRPWGQACPSQEYWEVAAKAVSAVCAKRAKDLIDPQLETGDGEPLGEYVAAAICQQ